jgi:predicted RNA binding protein YcfA (HicA-like mRNA interferase family)
MPTFGPIKQQELVSCLRKLGFKGPYSGGKHQFMVREGLRLRIPNPHGEDIRRPLLARLLREAGIDRADWERL